MRDFGNATARGFVAALTAVVFAVPAAVAASDGSTGANSGGGATYYETSTESAGISLAARQGAWLGRRVRIRGIAEGHAGQTLAIERRTSRRRGWMPLATVRVGDDGRFRHAWRADRTGRHELRALATRASSADSTHARAASTIERVTVYKRLMATWYGPGFYGNRTACGQRLTRRTLGVAHKRLPCGTKVAVRYRGRSITVPVIDRGPYAAGISYDLTSATAARLGVSHTVRIGAARLTR